MYIENASHVRNVPVLDNKLEGELTALVHLVPWLPHVVDHSTFQSHAKVIISIKMCLIQIVVLVHPKVVYPRQRI